MTSRTFLTFRTLSPAQRSFSTLFHSRLFFLPMRRSLPAITLVALSTLWTTSLVGQIDSSGQTDEPKQMPAAEIPADQLEFFEKRIRPVLVEHCYECHSQESDSVQAGLWVDSREGLIEGGDSGPAIEPFDPDASLLMEALRYESYEMPPEGKLAAEQIEDFAKWIEMGAPDPRVDPRGGPRRPTIDFEAGRAHWAYQPIASSTPHSAGTDSPVAAEPLRQPIDAFIRTRLQTAELAPTPRADRATLIRRLTFDLTGLPPTPEAISEFVADDRPDAYERLVDRLLDSPHFGEHWARHWLDVVRYAESLTLRGFVLPQAWRYRDYVIESFNQDRPYDQFLRQQLAGDLLPADNVAERQANLIATTFLTLGNTNLEQQDKRQLELDVVDEQLDVIGKGLLAQTITCARCHDHKFDPIPTKDYYALAGILANVEVLEHANVSKWIEAPLPVPADEAERYAAAQQRITELQAKLKQQEGELASLEQKTALLEGIVVDQLAGEAIGEWTSSTYTKPFVGDDYAHDGNAGKGEKSFRFSIPIQQQGQYEVRLAYTPGGNRASNVPVTIIDSAGTHQQTVNQRQRPPILNQLVSLGEYTLAADSSLQVVLSNAGTDGHVIVDAIQVLPLGTAQSAGEESDAEIQRRAERESKITHLRSQISELKQQINQHRQVLQQRPHAMVIRERQDIKDLPVHIRGNVHNLGETVPRGMLHVIEGPAPGIDVPANESGRRELANWVASPAHPLTARVYANRVWSWLWGRGIVRTVDNFGTTGSEPTHPELLDYLAEQLISSGWSTKELVREIVLSDAYQQSSRPSAAARESDPGNELLSHAPRKRLSAEGIRDAMLFATGQLDTRMGGPSFPDSLSKDYGFEYDGKRRSIYVPVFRNSLPELFEVFDFPNPSLVSGQRATSTTAPQALWMLNHPFAIKQAQRTARRLLQETNDDSSTRLKQAYLTILGRVPTSAEETLSLQFVQAEMTQGSSAEEAWSLLVQSLFASVDFRYVE